MSAKDQYLLADMAARSFGKSRLLAFAYNNANRLMTLRRDFVATESAQVSQMSESVSKAMELEQKLRYSTWKQVGWKGFRHLTAWWNLSLFTR